MSKTKLSANWVKMYNQFRCSNCKALITNNSTTYTIYKGICENNLGYCYSCGAKMVGSSVGSSNVGTVSKTTLLASWMDEVTYYRCSNCYFTISADFDKYLASCIVNGYSNYCPKCGAKMVGKDKIPASQLSKYKAIFR